MMPAPLETIAWQESGEGRPLVLLHGWGMHAGHLSPLAAHLSGLHLYCPDLPGHGNSPPLPAFDLSSLTRALLDWLDRRQLAQVALGGWSLGGMLALSLAATAPERVGQLILIGTAPSFLERADFAGGLPAGQVRALARDLQRRGNAALDDFFVRIFAGDRCPADEILSNFPELLPSQRPPQPATLHAGLELLRLLDLRPLLPQIRVRTLIVHGENDAIIPVAGGQALAAALGAAQTFCLAGCGHAPQLSHPAATAALIRNFLE